METLDYARPMPPRHAPKRPFPPFVQALTLILVTSVLWLSIYDANYHRQEWAFYSGACLLLSALAAWRTIATPPGWQRKTLIGLVLVLLLTFGCTVTECPHHFGVFVGPFETYSAGTRCGNGLHPRLWWYALYERTF